MDKVAYKQRTFISHSLALEFQGEDASRFGIC
jgi:hypothetical protein